MPSDPPIIITVQTPPIQDEPAVVVTVSSPRGPTGPPGAEVVTLTSTAYYALTTPAEITFDGTQFIHTPPPTIEEPITEP